MFFFGKIMLVLSALSYRRLFTLILQHPQLLLLLKLTVMSTIEMYNIRKTLRQRWLLRISGGDGPLYCQLS